MVGVVPPCPSLPGSGGAAAVRACCPEGEEEESFGGAGLPAQPQVLLAQGGQGREKEGAWAFSGRWWACGWWCECGWVGGCVIVGVGVGIR